jgi:hypothetical protein
MLLFHHFFQTTQSLLSFHASLRWLAGCELLRRDQMFKTCDDRLREARTRRDAERKDKQWCERKNKKEERERSKPTVLLLPDFGRLESSGKEVHKQVAR